MTTFVMLSHVTRRSGARAKSLASLRAAGIAPTVIESHAVTGGDAEVRMRGYEALTLAHPGGLVWLEDDIEVRPDLFTRHVAMAERAGVTTAFCAVNKRHYPPGVLEASELEAALLPMPDYAADRGFHGSMAVYIPPAMVAHGCSVPWEFMENPGFPLETLVIPPDKARGKVTGFDFWIKHTAQAFGGMFVAVPNSVDHDDQGSVHAGRKGAWRSPSFPIPEHDFLETIC